jgi:hypothetical protein
MAIRLRINQLSRLFSMATISFSNCKVASKIIISIPVLLFVFSALFFTLQQGFGGGHMVYDIMVFISAIPALPLIVAMERTGIYTNSDFINMLLLPFFWNLTICLVIVRVIEGCWLGLGTSSGRPKLR